MITQKEQAFFDRLKLDPQVRDLISRLQLEPIPSEAYKRSRLVEERIDIMIKKLQQANSLPVVQRSTYTEPSGDRIFWTHAQIKEWITTTNFKL